MMLSKERTVKNAFWNVFSSFIKLIKKKNIRKIKLSIVIAIMMCCVGLLSVKAEAANKTLKFDQNMINQVGIQPAGSVYCSAYALAYCRTILDGRVRNWNEFWVNGTGAVWSRGNYSKQYTTNKLAAFQAIYDRINANSPVIIYAGHTGLYTGDHWIAIVGYQNVTDRNNLSAGNFLMFDSGYIGNSTPKIEALNVRGCDLGVTGGNYVYLTTPDYKSDPVQTTWANKKENVSETNAILGITYNAGSSKYFGYVGLYINGQYACGYDPGYQGSSYSFSFNLKNDANMTLQPGQTYKYKFYVNTMSGDTFSPEYSFTTPKSDNQKPVIKSAKVVEKDSLGYVVEIVATDNNNIARVQCPTWTENNGQDDLQKDWVSNPVASATYVGGNTYRYRVNISEHNGEYGIYNTHVYVYDASSNQSMTVINGIPVNKEAMPKKIKTYNNNIYAIYDENYNWAGKVLFAKNTDSTLASVINDGEQSVITELVKGMYYPYYSIGGYQEGIGKPWKWLDGNAFSYSNWSSNQPDCAGNNEFYITAKNESGKYGKWNDVPGDYTQAGFITKTSVKLEPSASIEIGDSVYKFYKQKLPYSIAEEFAKANGGQLATIKNSTVSDKISQKVKELNCYFYIGLTDREKEGTFIWSDGTKAEYTNFAKGEPNNGGGEVVDQDYVLINKDTGLWDDGIGQYNIIGFIVESKKKATPVPTLSPSPHPVATTEPTIVSKTTPLPNIMTDPTPEPATTTEATTKPTAEPTIEPKKEKEREKTIEQSYSTTDESVSRSELGISYLYGEGGKKKVTLFWAKNNKADGYEIHISSKKNFKGKKIKYVPNKKCRVKIKSLKSKKRYYVRIRAYKDGVYGKWKKTKVKIR